ncbi:MAG: UDP-N-acetylmuramate dehydrogenase [Actinomycetota bacterium]|nr:UDP-N-acetylmuramate dehydrogenase [Actinomycetota bacterium]
MNDTFLRLELISEVRLERNVPLSRLTTWRVGGPADALITVQSVSGLIEVMNLLSENSIPFVVLGNGSNVLVSDSGFRGGVIRLSGELSSITAKGTYIEAGGGALLRGILRESVDSLLSGAEFLSGIPGTLGGAIITNAGAFGKELTDILFEISTLSSRGEIISRKEIEPGYRHALIPEGEIVVSAVLSLRRSSRKEIEKTIAHCVANRRKTQPAGEATAGSVFKNPTEMYAAELIESCGLKGLRSGGARISEIHSNFIVNEGTATARDILCLIKNVQKIVKEKRGVDLEPEVKLIGFQNVEEVCGV